jgi:dTDP-4-dehydrorhamnose 3,5-epimerase
MIFTETKLKGAYIIGLEPIQDERGFFARSFCAKEFAKNGLNFNIVQCNISHNEKRGTLRGMHYQTAPHQEAKIVSCTKGSVFDVIIDLRPDSPTYCQWFAIELTAHRSPLAANYKMLYIPEGFAHGFQTLEDDSVVFYQMSEFYHPECARGVRFDDPVFNIQWPIKEMIISERDRNFKFIKRV